MTVSQAHSGVVPSAVPAAMPADVAWGRVTLAAVVLTGFVLGEAPLLYKFFVDLWQRPQYQFFPLLLLALPFMTVSCLRDVAADTVRPGHWGVTAVLWTAAWALLVAGAALYLKWVAPLSTLLLLAGGLWVIGGGRLLRALVPVGVMLLLIVPPPGHLDADLLVRLRQWAVACSGRLLDLLGVPIFVQGTVIQIPGDRLMVAEACSGINSMLAVLAFTVLVTFWKRLPTGALLMLLPAAFVYVFWANVLRITVCAYARAQFGIDLLSGTVHELLGLALFVGSMGLVFSTVALGQWLLGWDGVDDADSPANAAPAAAARPVRRWPWAVAAVAFGVTGAGVLARTHAAWPLSTLPSAMAFDLPKTLAGWTRVERDAQSPERAEVSGLESHLWQYRRAGRTVTVGMDYPFYGGYHDCTICYSLAGWHMPQVGETAPDASGRRAFAATLQKPPLAQGQLLFALCDESGAWVPRPAALPNESATAFTFRLARERAVSPPLVQVQVLGVAYEPLTDAEKAAIARLFSAAGDAIDAQLRARAWERRP